MNVKLLRKVAKHIAAEPRRYDQDKTLEFLKEEAKVALGSMAPPCGTMGCIAGWTCVITGKTKRAKRSFGYRRAQKQLQLTKDQAHRLFAYSWADEGWPKNFRMGYRLAATKEEKARIAVARIEHFIKTKGQE